MPKKVLQQNVLLATVVFQRCFATVYDVPNTGVTRGRQNKPSNTQETKTTSNPAEDNSNKQCTPNETKPNSNKIHPRKRHNNPTHNHTPSRIKSTHTSQYRCIRLQEVCRHRHSLAEVAFQVLSPSRAIVHRIHDSHACVTLALVRTPHRMRDCAVPYGLECAVMLAVRRATYAARHATCK